jgi:hypothetical protein
MRYALRDLIKWAGPALVAGAAGDSTAAAEPSQVVLLSAVTVTRRHARALARSGREERQPTRARLRFSFL